MCISWARCGGGEDGGLVCDVGDAGEGWVLFSILFLWNQTWSHITEASRVNDWASYNWRFRCCSGLSMKATQSEMDVNGRRFGWIGHGEVS